MTTILPPEPLTLHINGTAHTLDLPPDTPLIHVLRNDLGLKGSKVGCAQEQCNACKVLVDGVDVPSCRLPIGQLRGVQIVTVEGLGTPDNLHPLQAAFMDEQAIQCGYCAAGMIIAAQGLLNRTRYPTDDEIRTALEGNICRCGVYERIRRAVKLRIARPERTPIYAVAAPEPLDLPAASLLILPVSLQETPQLDAWVRINADETIDIFTGKVEIGQGIKTAVAQIAADELDVAPARIRVCPVDTDLSPDEGLTAGSMSLQTTGNAIRLAAADARHVLLEVAHEELECARSLATLTVDDGVVSDPATGRTVTYWQLFGGRRFGRVITGQAKPKRPEQRRLTGQPMTRLDLAAKVTGTFPYVHDLELPGMVHGRVLRPPSYHARLVALDTTAVEAMAGVLAVVRDGTFVGVIAQREEQALAAVAALATAARWTTGVPLPEQIALYADLQARPALAYPLRDGCAVDEPIPPVVTPPAAAQTLSATYQRPFQMHASLGPSAAVARWDAPPAGASHMDGPRLTVWSHTQGPFVLKRAIASTLGLAEESVRVVHTEGAGCYGHNGAEDAAFDAVLLARALPGRPVSLKWSRADEHMWEPYGPAMVGALQASLDDGGRIVDWNHDIWSYPHATRPRPAADTSGFLAAWHLATPWPAPTPRTVVGGRHFGSYRNADPLYLLPRQRIVTHFVAESPLRTSAMRSLGAYANIFAIESFMDELALAAGIDPVAFRLRHLDDPRAIAVIEAAADRLGWQSRLAAGNTDRGQGMAFAQYKNLQCYAAVAVEVSVDRATGRVQLEHAVIAADAGEVVNPDGLSNQLEGGFVQAASWTLLEEVQFQPSGITSRDWDSYPVLRATGVPRLETILLNRPELPFLGAGEATQNPTPAAIANAIFDATGLRLRRIPFTPERVRAALDATAGGQCA